MSRDTKVLVLLVLVVIGAIAVLRFMFHMFFRSIWWVALIGIGIYIGYKMFKK